LGVQKIDAEKNSEKSADREHQRDQDNVKDCYSFVIGGE
jgi:hypothetical protein